MPERHVAVPGIADNRVFEPSVVILLLSQVSGDERVLIDREVGVLLVEVGLADDLGVDDPDPAPNARSVAVEVEEMLGLHGAGGMFALERERMVPAPVAPVVPSTEAPVDFRVGVDGGARAAGEHHHAPAGVEVGREFLEGVRRIRRDVEARREELGRDVHDRSVEASIERLHETPLSFERVQHLCNDRDPNNVQYEQQQVSLCTPEKP